MANEFDNKWLGSRIRSLREAKDLSQVELAKVIGISRPAVSRIEMGERKLAGIELVKLAKYLNISVDSLVDPAKDIEVIVAPSSVNVPPAGIRISVPQNRVDKFEAVLLHILSKVGSKPNIGETVVYKLLYFMDYDYYERYEEQLIGATYIKNYYGPTPVEFKNVVEDMVRRGMLELVDSQYFQYPQRKYLPLIEPDLSILSAREIDMIDRVLRRLSDMNAAEISRYSHDDVPWIVTEDQQPLEYESVFYRTEQYSVREYIED